VAGISRPDLSLWSGSLGHTFGVNVQPNATIAQMPILGELPDLPHSADLTPFAWRPAGKSAPSDVTTDIGATLAQNTGFHHFPAALLENWLSRYPLVFPMSSDINMSQGYNLLISKLFRNRSDFLSESPSRVMLSIR
jgi:hypothetical protein